jgi:hypothetical protein
MKKLFQLLLIFVVVVLAAYNIWAAMGRAAEQPVSKLIAAKFTYVSFGADSGKGNIIGIQPYLTAANYSTAANFKASVSVYFEQLKKGKHLTPKSIVVLPEYIGTWLVAVNEKEALYQPQTMKDAMATLVSSNFFKFISLYYNAPAKDKTKYALFSMKGEKMAAIYEAVFSDLAKEFNCTIAAGSIALPGAFINSSGHLETTTSGEIFNTAAVFGNDGTIIPPLVKKIFPVNDEQSFSACGKQDQVPVYHTSAGRMALLICADSWFPKAYQKITGKADFIVIPSFGSMDTTWQAPWGGYNGFAAPADVDTALYHKITEGDAWVKYSMGKRAPQAGIHYGMNVFFTGTLWDLKTEGRVLVLNNDSLTVLKPLAGQGRMVNLFIQ